MAYYVTCCPGVAKKSTYVGDRLARRHGCGRYTVFIGRGTVPFSKDGWIIRPIDLSERSMQGDNAGVSIGRIALVVTCVVVAGLGATFVLLQWDQANRFPTVASALGAVAAVGVAIWAAVPGHAASMRATQTGKATATYCGVAISGVQAPAAPGQVRADRARDATGGQATSGIRLD